MALRFYLERMKLIIKVVLLNLIPIFSNDFSAIPPHANKSSSTFEELMILLSNGALLSMCEIYLQ